MRRVKERKEERYFNVNDQVSRQKLIPCRHLTCLSSMCWKLRRGTELLCPSPPGSSKGSATSVRIPPHSVSGLVWKHVTLTLSIVSGHQDHPAKQGCTSGPSGYSAFRAPTGHLPGSIYQLFFFFFACTNFTWVLVKVEGKQTYSAINGCGRQQKNSHSFPLLLTA